MTTKLKYIAFLSYSHRDNLVKRPGDSREHIQWANWLHELLETYETPEDLIKKYRREGKALPERIYPVFQDEKELPTNSDLGASIKVALEQSEFLIVICSPRSATSRYVNEEVKYFKELGRANKILPIIIDGEPNASEKYNDERSKQLECFCPSLRFRVLSSGVLDENVRDIEPICADLRAEENKIEITAPDWESEKETRNKSTLKLIAGLLGINYDDLIQREHIRELKKARRRIRNILVTTFILLIALLSGFIALRMSDKAKTEKEIALQQEREKQCLELITRAKNIYQEEPTLGVSLANLAYKNASDNILPFVSLTFTDIFNDYHNNADFVYNTVIDTREISQNQGDIPSFIISAEYSPDGNFILVNSSDGNLSLWRNNGMLVKCIHSPGDGFSSSCFSPGGAKIVTTSRDSLVVIRDYNLDPIFEFGDINEVYEYARFSPNGNYILTESADKLSLWDENGNDLNEWNYINNEHGHQRRAIKFLKDDLICSGDSNGKLRIYNTNLGTETVIQAHDSTITSLDYSLDKNILISSSNDNTVKLWIPEGKILKTIYGFRRGVDLVKFFPDGTKLITVSSEKEIVRIWTNTGQLITEIEPQYMGIESIDFSSNNERFVTASTDKTAKLWSAAGILLGNLRGHSHWVLGAWFSPDNKSIITYGFDGTAKIWNSGSEHALFDEKEASIEDYKYILKIKSPKDIDWSLDKNKTVSRSKKDSICGVILDLKHVMEGDNGVIDLVGHKSKIVIALFSPDETKVLTASEDGEVRIWDANDGKLFLSKQAFEHAVSAASFTLNGETVLLGSEKGQISIISISGKGYRTWEAHSSIINSIYSSKQDDKIVSSSYDYTAKVWDFNGELITTLQGQSIVNSARFSHDGKYIATGSNDFKVKIWDLSGNLHYDRNLRAGYVYDVNFLLESSVVIADVSSSEVDVQIPTPWYLSEWLSIRENCIRLTKSDLDKLKLHYSLLDL